MNNKSEYAPFMIALFIIGSLIAYFFTKDE